MKFDSEISDLEYFSGGVPAGAVFQTNTDDLRKIAAAPDIKPAEVCLIGLVAYFEAFFKDHFASIVNIQPRIAENLRKADFDTSVDVCDIVSLGNRYEIRLGSLLAEKYDFGTAKRVNSIYHGLLMVTPFAKDEISQCDRLLNDRNLIVHHGGIYTLRYMKQKFGSGKSTEDAYWDSLVITTETFFEALSFCETIVLKTIKSTKHSLENYVSRNGIVQSEANKRALSFLDLWLEEEDYDESEGDERD